ncbi:MAG: hypothetical protein NDJ92_04630 [Thermoanaerobaculia bacterium]|nr:hypothetical protein [Thermoanaerobaculia bacterium]
MADTKHRTKLAAAIAIVLALSCGISSLACKAAAGDPPYKIVEQPLKLFSCSSGTHWVLSSRDEALAFLDELDANCFRQPDAEAWKQSFLRDLERAGVDFDRDSVILVQKVYGSGMINARLEFDLGPKRVLRADLQAVIPDGPLTPDLGIRSLAFTVDRTKVDKVVMLVDGKELETIDLP